MTEISVDYKIFHYVKVTDFSLEVQLLCMCYENKLFCHGKLTNVLGSCIALLLELSN